MDDDVIGYDVAHYVPCVVYMGIVTSSIESKFFSGIMRREAKLMAL